MYSPESTGFHSDVSSFSSVFSGSTFMNSVTSGSDFFSTGFCCSSISTNAISSATSSFDSISFFTFFGLTSTNSGTEGFTFLISIKSSSFKSSSFVCSEIFDSSTSLNSGTSTVFFARSWITTFGFNKSSDDSSFASEDLLIKTLFLEESSNLFFKVSKYFSSSGFKSLEESSSNTL